MVRRKLPANAKRVGIESGYIANTHHPLSPLSKEKRKVGLLVGSVTQTEEEFFFHLIQDRKERCCIACTYKNSKKS